MHHMDMHYASYKHAPCIHVSKSRWSTWGSQKHYFLKFNGCPILSQVIGIEMLRTLFVSALAHLEGPPQAYAFFNGDIGGKI